MKIESWKPEPEEYPRWLDWVVPKEVLGYYVFSLCWVLFLYMVFSDIHIFFVLLLTLWYDYGIFLYCKKWDIR